MEITRNLSLSANVDGMMELSSKPMGDDIKFTCICHNLVERTPDEVQTMLAELGKFISVVYANCGLGTIDADTVIAEMTTHKQVAASTIKAEEAEEPEVTMSADD